MTETRLKDIFRETLTGEPTVSVPTDEDIARGRARKKQLWRNRAAGGVAVLVVAGLGAAVLPAVFGDDGDGVSVADGGESGDPDGDAGGGSYPPAVGDDPIKQHLWDAIEAALPADVEVVTLDDTELQVAPEVGPSIGVLLERGENGLGFQFRVSVEQSRPDLPEYRPCTEPGLLEGTWSQWQNCVEGRDDDGVWRAAGDLVDFGSAVLLAENDDVSVNVNWSTRPYPLPDSEPTQSGGERPTGPTLDRAEGEAVREAVLAAAADLDPDDLTSGAELSAVADAWPEVRSILEQAVGSELTPVGGDDPVVDLQDPDFQVGTVSAEYVTADGAEVEVWFWQRPRVSEPMCLEAIYQCSSFTGGQELLAPADGGGQNHEGGGNAGPRGDLWLRVSSDVVAGEPTIDDAGTMTLAEGDLSGSMSALMPLSELLTGLVQSPFEGG
jgi:hypothetical protein